MTKALPHRIRVSSLVLALALAAPLAPACGGEDAPPAGPGPVAVDAFRAEYESASCAYQVRCGLMPDEATCLRLGGADDVMLQMLADVNFGTVEYDADAARRCVDALRDRTCETTLAAQQAFEDACGGVFEGTVADGGPCLIDGECSGDGVCDTSMCMGGPCCFGACQPAPGKVAVGGDCLAAACVDDAYCDVVDDGMGNVTATCQARAENGQACTAPQGCLDGQRCNLSGDSGTCYILSKDGEACNPNLSDACLSFASYCDPASSTCGLLPGPGAPCSMDGRCLDFAYCDAGTCRTRPVEGEACPPDGPQCLGDLRCEADVCTAPPTATVCAPSDGNG